MSAEKHASAQPARRRFDAFIFDLDGTVLDTLPDLVALTNATLEDLGYPPHTTAEIASYVGNGGLTLMRQAVPTGTAEADVATAFARWKERYPEFGYKLTKPYPDIAETVRLLRSHGMKTAVLSNKFDQATRELIASFFPGLFDAVHGECSGFPRKPNPAGLLRTIEELEATPARTAYVGDSPGDMETARAAGCCAVGVAWGYRSIASLEAAGASCIVSAPKDLLLLQYSWCAG